MTPLAELDAAIAEVAIEKTRMTNAGNTRGANELQKKIDALTIEKTRRGG